MPVTLRIGTKEDAELIADLSIETFRETFADQNSPENMEKFLNQVFTREKLINEVGTKHNIFLIAFLGSEPVGYVRLREFNSPPELAGLRTMELARIYVKQSCIGKGIGRLLMQKSIEISSKLKKDTIWLGVWEHNFRAIDFYRKWGFEKFGTQVFLLGDDPQTDWMMKKNLVSPDANQ